MVVLMAETVALGDVIRRFRFQAGMSQESLADISGVDRSYISMIENNLRKPSYDIVKALANAMGLQASTIYRAAEMESPRPDDESEDEEVIVRVDDPRLAASLRRIARWGYEYVNRLEQAGIAFYKDQVRRDLPNLPPEPRAEEEGKRGTE